MACYEIIMRPSARKELNRVGNVKLRQKIVDKIDGLADDPYAAAIQKVASVKEPNTYRIRQGDYRIIFTIDDRARLIRILQIARRDVVYQQRRLK